MTKKHKLLVVTAMWGAWHISKFLDLNLPTLLADRNFPALGERCDITYLVYTSQKDMDQVQAAPGLQVLRQYMDLQFRIIPADLLVDPILAHHRIWAEATLQAKKEGSFILMMPPDVAWSNGSFEYVSGLLEAGKKAIFMTYLRVESESFTTALKGRKLPGSTTIAVSGAELVEISMHTLHPLMAAYLRDSSHFPIHPEMMLWTVPKEGLICRVLAREMFIYDPSTIELNSANLLATNLDLDAIHMVDDSDDLFAVSLAPYDKEFEWYRWPRTANTIAVSEWWLDYDSWINDYISGLKVRWHYRPVTEASWQARELGGDLFLRRAAALREGRRLFRAARSLGCTKAASVIAAAVQSGVISRTARGRGGALVFLPVDAAFDDHPAQFPANCFSVDREHELAELVAGHFVPNDLPNEQLTLAEQLGLFKQVNLTAADGAALRVTRHHGRLEVNGVRILSGSIRFGKNHVYTIERMLGVAAEPSSQDGVATTDSKNVLMRPKLTVEAYDQAENAARVSASYPALRSFAPATFAMVGFPTRVTQEKELRRYADIMYEIADREYWLKKLTYSEEEQSLIIGLRSKIEALTGTLFGNPVQALMCLFPPLPVLRMVEATSALLGRKLRILEVGPGSGYFGAYSLMRGHQYAGIDNTQALYLWRHRLFDWVAGGDFRDHALEPLDSPVPMRQVEQAALIPWWKFAGIYRQVQSLPQFDIIVCEAAMGEMDPFGARYLIHLSKLLLEKSEAGLFLYQNLGEERQSDRAKIAHLFAAHGFRSYTCGSVTVQAGSNGSPDGFLKSLKDGPQPVSFSSKSETKTGVEFLDIDPSKLMESYSFFEFLRLDLG